MRVEIRCCCNPGKLLGTVEVPGGIRGRGVNFELMYDGTTATLFLEWGKFRIPPTFTERGSEGIALKSMDTSMDVLRRIGSFKEAGNVD